MTDFFQLMQQLILGDRTFLSPCGILTLAFGMAGPVAKSQGSN